MRRLLVHLEIIGKPLILENLAKLVNVADVCGWVFHADEGAHAREPMRGWPSLEPWLHRNRYVGQCILRRSLCLPFRMQVIPRITHSAPKSLPRQSSK